MFLLSIFFKINVTLLQYIFTCKLLKCRRRLFGLVEWCRFGLVEWCWFGLVEWYWFGLVETQEVLVWFGWVVLVWFGVSGVGLVWRSGVGLVWLSGVAALLSISFSHLMHKNYIRCKLHSSKHVSLWTLLFSIYRTNIRQRLKLVDQMTPNAP